MFLICTSFLNFQLFLSIHTFTHSFVKIPYRISNDYSSDFPKSNSHKKKIIGTYTHCLYAELTNSKVREQRIHIAEF